MKNTTSPRLINRAELRGVPVRQPARILPFPAPVAPCPHLCVAGMIQRPVYCCAVPTADCCCLGLAVDLVLEPCTCPAGVAAAEREADEVIAAAGGAPDPANMGTFPGEPEFPF